MIDSLMGASVAHTATAPARPTDLGAPEDYPPRLPAVTRLPVVIESREIREIDPGDGTVVRAWRYDQAPHGVERGQRQSPDRFGATARLPGGQPKGPEK